MLFILPLVFNLTFTFSLSQISFCINTIFYFPFVLLFWYRFEILFSAVIECAGTSLALGLRVFGFILALNFGSCIVRLALSLGTFFVQPILVGKVLTQGLRGAIWVAFMHCLRASLALRTGPVFAQFVSVSVARVNGL